MIHKILLFLVFLFEYSFKLWSIYTKYIIYTSLSILYYLIWTNHNTYIIYFIFVIMYHTYHWILPICNITLTIHDLQINYFLFESHILINILQVPFESTCVYLSNTILWCRRTKYVVRVLYSQVRVLFHLLNVILSDLYDFFWVDLFLFVYFLYFIIHRLLVFDIIFQYLKLFDYHILYFVGWYLFYLLTMICMFIKTFYTEYFIAFRTIEFYWHLFFT